MSINPTVVEAEVTKPFPDRLERLMIEVMQRSGMEADASTRDTTSHAVDFEELYAREFGIVLRYLQMPGAVSLPWLTSRRNVAGCYAT
jgi:hypothetical protein